MTRLNTIFSDEEYKAQGFTTEEVPKVREHDILFNKYVMEEITEEEKERMFALVKELGL